GGGWAGRAGPGGGRAAPRPPSPRHACSRAGDDPPPAPSEDERIATLEPHHEPSRLGVMDHDRVDGRLVEAMAARGLAGEDAQGTAGGLGEARRMDEVIVDDHHGPAAP